MTGTDRFGRTIDLKTSFNAAIDGLRNKFRKNVKRLNGALDDFYDALCDEFESRFRTKLGGDGSFGQKARIASGRGEGQS
jgi:hypothetical protein